MSEKPSMNLPNASRGEHVDLDRDENKRKTWEIEDQIRQYEENQGREEEEEDKNNVQRLD